MQGVPAKLPFAIDCLNKNLPLSPSLLNALLAALPQQSAAKPAQVVLHLLRIIQDDMPGSTSPGSAASRLASILQALLPVLDTRSPLRELLWGKSNLFADRCRHSADDTLKQVESRSYGLYPPCEPNSPHLPLYQRAPNSATPATSGNPNWLLSRLSLSLWARSHH